MMPYVNCPHCDSIFSTRGLTRHIEVIHSEHAIDFKHNLIIKLTKAQRTALGKACHKNNLNYNVNYTVPEFAVHVLEWNSALG